MLVLSSVVTFMWTLLLKFNTRGAIVKGRFMKFNTHRTMNRL